MPRSAGAGAVKVFRRCDPGRRPSSRVSSTSGALGSRRTISLPDRGTHRPRSPERAQTRVRDQRRTAVKGTERVTCDQNVRGRPRRRRRDALSRRRGRRAAVRSGRPSGPRAASSRTTERPASRSRPRVTASEVRSRVISKLASLASTYSSVSCRSASASARARATRLVGLALGDPVDVGVGDSRSRSGGPRRRCRSASRRPSATTASRSASTRSDVANAARSSPESSSTRPSSSARLTTAEADIGIDRASSTVCRSSASFACTSTSHVPFPGPVGPCLTPAPPAAR